MEIEIHKYHEHKILASIHGTNNVAYASNHGINNVVYVSIHGAMD